MLKELTVCCPAISEPEDLSLDLASFPMVSELILKIPEIGSSPKGDVEQVRVIASEIVKMPRLQSLDLYSLGIDHEIIEIIANHQRTNQNVRCLVLQYDTVSSLTAFKNLNFLYLDIEDPNANATVSEMNTATQTLSGLKGLNLMDNNSPFEMQLLQSIGHQLQYLELHYVGCGSTINLGNTNFGNLNQLVIGEDCGCDFRDIWKTATNLEKLKIDFSDDDIEKESSFITKIIVNCKKL